jgi:hypothetical protein
MNWFRQLELAHFDTGNSPASVSLSYLHDWKAFDQRGWQLFGCISDLFQNSVTLVTRSRLQITKLRGEDGIPSPVNLHAPQGDLVF